MEHSKASLEVQTLNLCLSVPLPKKKGSPPNETKVILQDITAAFKPGRMTAIMGPSGAGKTSLLSVLSGDILKKAKLSGDVLVNGISCPGRKMKKISGFVFQDDVLFNTMTVQEAVGMSALLRLPNSISKDEKKRRVDEVIEVLGLEKARNTQIGTPEKKGISGGERKRTAIAMEMVTNPQILWLDEPTSGLDTLTAYNCVARLKDLARAGRTVVATIHQPSSKTFMLFDDLLLLAEGRIVYQGPVSEVVPYMESQGFTCPPFMNPADFLFMEVLKDADPSSSSSSLSIKVMSEKDESSSTLGLGGGLTPTLQLLNTWESGVQQEIISRNIQKIKESNSINSTTEVFASSFKEKSSFGTQFKFLSARAGKSLLRDKSLITARIGRAVFMGLLMSLVNYDLSSKKGFAQTQDRIQALFFFCTNEFFSSSGNTIFAFAAEKGVFLREFNNGYYSLTSYFFSKVLLELPLTYIAPLITVCIAYPIIGLRPDLLAFVKFVTSVQLMTLVGTAFGLLLGAALPNFQVAMAVMPALTLPMMIFGGAQVNLDALPKYLKFMPALSPIRWAFSCLAQIELRDLEFPDCQPGTPCSGNEVLEFFALANDPSIYIDWLILLSMFLAFTMMGFFFLWRATRK